MIHKYTKVFIPTGQKFEEETKDNQDFVMVSGRQVYIRNREGFLELINEWNRLACLASEIKWIYYAN